jgi:hypothetical protein
MYSTEYGTGDYLYTITFTTENTMKNYDNAPKREPMKKRGVRVGSLTANRRHILPQLNGAKKRVEKNSTRTP